MLLKKAKAKEESLDFTTKGSVIAKAKGISNAGRLGRDFFAGKNIFMDFNHRVLIICSELKDIRKEGYEIKNLITVPFKNTSDGIVLEIETDMGKKKFVLDTGTTVSVIRTENLNKVPIQQKEGTPITKTSKFIIGGIDFGWRELYLLDISREFKIDGLLGMDFLKDHMVYLDFTKKTVYIGKSSK